MATLVALLAQVNVTPVMVLPLLSFAVAVNCCVAPKAIEGDAGETVMLASVGGGLLLLLLLSLLLPQEASRRARAMKKTDAQNLFTEFLSRDI